ncbi:hypothetical protein [Streptomyces poriticola]|uniref:hypothetical protein n=1 Tax=Streptomyces poriticola TaxID=3120506 RepID=UPI002FCE5499
MQGKGTRRGGAAPDVEAMLDELYTTPPPGFVPRREELAAAARTAGRAEDARRIHAARRPTLAAWAANLLLRDRPEEAGRLLELGESLREAYRTLDAGELKSLSAQRRIVAALTAQAARLAEEAGQPLSAAVRQDVETTLQAVLADRHAADRWATGRLTGALTPPSAFPGTTAVEPRRPAPVPARRTTAPPPKDQLAEQRRKRRERLEQARAAAGTAAGLLDARRTERAAAQAGLQAAREHRAEAEQAVTDAEQRLRLAREDLTRADRERRGAEERDRAAREALTTAERAARAAEREVERLTRRDG